MQNLALPTFNRVQTKILLNGGFKEKKVDHDMIISEMSFQIKKKNKKKKLMSPTSADLRKNIRHTKTKFLACLSDLSLQNWNDSIHTNTNADANVKDICTKIKVLSYLLCGDIK